MWQHKFHVTIPEPLLRTNVYCKKAETKAHMRVKKQVHRTMPLKVVLHLATTTKFAAAFREEVRMATQISTSGNNCGKQRVARSVFWRGMLHWVIFHATRARFATKARKFVQCNGGLSFPQFSPQLSVEERKLSHCLVFREGSLCVFHPS